MLGYQFLIADAVTIDIFPGLQYKTKSSTITYANPSLWSSGTGTPTVQNDKNSKSGVGLRFGINVGFAF